MPQINDAPDNEIKRRFSVESAERWRLLLRHFSWSDEFAFIVLLAPGQEASEICARELETFFQESGKRLVKMIPKTPDDLVALIFPLVTFEPDPSVGALWVSAVVSESDPEHPAWLRAWRELAARLNERRDVLRFRVKIPLIFVGMEWLKPMLREIAPDLWSVRTLVIEMKWRPLAATGDFFQIPESIRLDSLVDESNLDPEFALAEAEKVRRRGGDEAMLARLLNRAGTAFRERGEFQKAELALREALEIRERTLGAEHPHTAASLSGLALLYKVQGEYAKALPLYERSLAIFEKALGAEHPLTAQGLNNLAGLYDDQGDSAKALPLYERSLAIREKSLGVEHPDTATSLNNLAGLYRTQGEYAQALPLYELSLAIFEKVLGAQHPNTARGLNNLALLYKAQGEYAKALPLYERSLAIREKSLGAEHPDTATSLNNLALLYHAQGDYAQALPLLERSLAIREKTLGVEHPNTKTAARNLEILRAEMAAPPQ
jgi:tetratricopeptide (TPR) repeat protein